MVYVDPLFTCTPNRRWRWAQASHLIADTVNELHVFAGRLGLKRMWFQYNSVIPHYDLTKNKRNAAIRLGAVEITSWEMVNHICEWRKECQSTQKC